MTRLLIRCVAVVAAVLAATAAIAQGEHRPSKARDVGLELVGQVVNSPTTSIQFGNVTQVGDLPVADELTFYTDTTTQRVVDNGPLRIVSRTGQLTIYHDPSADFGNPDSFRDGTPVLTATLRQQVILNTQTGAFTAHNVNTITSTYRFALGSEQVELGRVGRQFRTVISGQAASAAPPSAHMAGYTVPGS